MMHKSSRPAQCPSCCRIDFNRMVRMDFKKPSQWMIGGQHALGSLCNEVSYHQMHTNEVIDRSEPQQQRTLKSPLNVCPILLIWQH
mmetsp:Transcript_37212/g.59774  ORF Transcript_37212/g.59774 Transcript_37212/m.59774 type:complete len:86 (-) Transcript_37212:1565-1822(-)